MRHPGIGDIMSDMNNDQTHKSTKFPCPACGALMFFDPGSGNMRCDNCQKVIAIKPLILKS